MWDEVEEQSTTAGIIAKDADVLELLFRAYELFRYKGVVDAELWMNNNSEKLRTETARALYTSMIESDPSEWWKRIC